MAPEQRSEFAHALEASRLEFLAASNGVSDAQAKTSPGPGRWSVLECVEHVSLAEERFLGWLEQAELKEASPADRHKERELATLVIDRTRRANAPDAVRPTGRYENLAQALDQFNAARRRTVQFAQERAADLYSKSVEHPRFGKLNGAELILIIAGHARRHAEQIREAKAAVLNP